MTPRICHAANLFWLSLSILAVHPGQGAEDFDVALTVKHGKESQTARFESVAGRPAHARAVLRAKPAEKIQANWTVKRPAKSVAEDVLVHFFVVRESKLGQKEVPKLAPEQVIVESALTMDFPENGAANAQISFEVLNPGFYLVRIETSHTGTSELDPPFAALELEVTP